MLLLIRNSRSLVSFVLVLLNCTAVSDDGTSTKVVCMDGTIPTLHKGVIYNLPISIYLIKCVLIFAYYANPSCRGYPAIPPTCFVRPTSSLLKCFCLTDYISAMIIAPSQYVNANGLVILPYLQDWKSGESNMETLLKILCSVST